MLADSIADTTNRYPGIWNAAPVLVQLESNALDWLCDRTQFPAHIRGLFTVGGSIAMFDAKSSQASTGSAQRPACTYRDSSARLKDSGPEYKTTRTVPSPRMSLTRFLVGENTLLVFPRYASADTIAKDPTESTY